MAPSTDMLPKALLPVAGRPFADWQLMWLAAQGVDEVIYSIGHLGDQIRRHVGIGRAMGTDRPLCRRRSQPPGNGGSVASGVRSVCIGGTVSRPLRRLLSVRRRPQRLGCIRRQQECGSDVGVPQRRTSGNEATLCSPTASSPATRRGSRASRARCAMWTTGSPSSRGSTVERWIPRDAVVDLADTFTALSGAGELAGYEAVERFYEIGSPSGLKDLESRLHSSLTSKDVAPMPGLGGKA